MISLGIESYQEDEEDLNSFVKRCSSAIICIICRCWCAARVARFRHVFYFSSPPLVLKHSPSLQKSKNLTFLKYLKYVEVKRKVIEWFCFFLLKKNTLEKLKLLTRYWILIDAIFFYHQGKWVSVSCSYLCGLKLGLKDAFKVDHRANLFCYLGRYPSISKLLTLDVLLQSLDEDSHEIHSIKTFLMKKSLK